MANANRRSPIDWPTKGVRPFLRPALEAVKRMVRSHKGGGEIPAYGSPEFPRWLNGSLTRFCGVGMHDRCKGTIGTIGIECPCLCDCHGGSGEPGQ